ncbi:MAG: DNA primase [Gemmatimonadales bacterium]|nr:DNA primase [Gemmatimonadales bacterium]
MSMIPDETVEQVRDSADIVGIISESVELKRTGADYRGPCPFHGGKGRNFAVIPKKGRYYCFVCHESGDVFSWLMKRLGMDYPTAVRDVARRTGIVIPERAERAGPDPREPLFEAVAVAHDWFARQLLERSDAKVAREYLEGRDISLETAALHGLGYAPVGKAFLAAMAELGVKDQVLLEAGLTGARDDGSVGPRFRGRLLFPIHDLRGRVAGFGGRLLGPGEPKYLNSPESAIFHKGKQLYNLHQARGAIRKEESVILVEGYFDVLRLVLAGVEHVVAPLGTALTPDQAILLKRLAPTATLLYDSDQAGLRATFRAGDELLRHAIRVRVATLPPGEDPDTLVRGGGAAALEPILRDAMDLLERKIQLLDQKGWFEGVEHQRDALDRLLPTIRAAADPAMRELYLSAVARKIDMRKDVLEHDVIGASPLRTAPPRATQAFDNIRPRAHSHSMSPDIQLLKAVLASDEWREKARHEVAPALIEDLQLRELYEAILKAEHPSQLPDGLSDVAQSMWTRLKEDLDRLPSPDMGSTYDQAAQILCAKPAYLKIDGLTDPGERGRVRADLRARFPQADQWYVYWKAGKRPKRAKGT